MTDITADAKPQKKVKDWLCPFLAAFISGTAICKFISLSTANILSLVFLFLLYPMYRASFKIKDKKIKIVSYICGALYTISFVLFKLNGLLNIEDRPYYSAYLWIAFIVGFFLLFGNLIALIYTKLFTTDFTMADPAKRTASVPKKTLMFFAGMAIMLLAWLPYFLKNFPGDITADSSAELMQAIGTMPYSNHHPIAHTMMIKLFFNLGLKLFGGDQTLAVATYSVCQAILLSAAFSYLLVTLYKFKVRKIIIFGVLAFYTIIPYHGVYSVTMWKDIWFGGIVVVLSTTIWRLIKYYNQKEHKIPFFELVMLFIFGAAMCLFRSNGLYAYILLVPFLFFIFFRKSFIPVVLSILVLPIAFLIKGPLYDSMGVEPPDTIESLSIPAQHIARAISDGAVITQEQYDLLSQVVDVEQIPLRYTPNISDSIKNLVRETDNQEYIEEHKKEFLELWIDIGLENPKSYILAQIDQTFGYWYPDVQYWLYAGEFRGYDSGYQVDRIVKLSDSAAEKVDTYLSSYMDITYWGLFWSIGTASWICVFMFGLCCIKRRKSYMVVYIPVLAVLATLMIATPVYAEFRYAYSLFTTIPLLCIVPFCRSKITEDEPVAEADTDVCQSEIETVSDPNGIIEAEVIENNEAGNEDNDNAEKTDEQSDIKEAVDSVDADPNLNETEADDSDTTSEDIQNSENNVIN